MLGLPDHIRACLFDIFGTVVDWRSSVSRELAAFAQDKNIRGVDWLEFAVEWRKLYQPSMEEVRSGRRAWTILDVLHRESLVRLIQRYGLAGLSEADVDHMNRAWHRLDPWPDVVPGLLRLARSHVLAPLSNGNVALIVEMAKRAGLPWDLVLGAEIVEHYKPDAEVYDSAPRLLALPPGEVLMVAAHVEDLSAARGRGLRTAYVHRPQEYGGRRMPPATDPDADYSVDSFTELADRLDAEG